MPRGDFEHKDAEMAKALQSMDTDTARPCLYPKCARDDARNHQNLILYTHTSMSNVRALQCAPYFLRNDCFIFWRRSNLRGECLMYNTMNNDPILASIGF